MKKQGNRGLLWSFVVIFLVLLFDQILKIWVKMNMTLGQEIPVIGSWFNLLFIENNGMAFGWLGGGGYAGWLHGRVVDMLYFPLIDVAKENASWLPDFFFGPDNHFIFFRPIFNFADAAITAGVFYMLIFQWKWLKTLN